MRGTTGLVGLVATVAAACMPTRAVQAQNAQPDSAMIYEQKAIAEASAMDDSATVRAMKYTRQALALFTQRGDERGQARSFARMAEIHAAEFRTDSAMIMARRAITILRRLKTDTLVLAEALATVSAELLIYGGSVDSAAAYWTESVTFFQKHPDRARVGAILDRHGYALLRRASRDSTFRQNVANLDSAAFYYRASIEASRLTRDSVFAGRSLGNIANVWRLRGRIDSVLVYRRRAVSVSLRVGDTLQALFDMSEIAATFRSPVRDRTVGITYNLDSALVWYGKTYELATRAGRPGQIGSALALSQIHDLKGRQDSARLYIRRALEYSRVIKNSVGERNSLTALADWYSLRGFDDSTLFLRRDAERSRTAGGTPAARAAQLTAWRDLGLAHAVLKQDSTGADSVLFWLRRVIDVAGSDSTLLSFRATAHGDLGNRFLATQQVDSAMWHYRQLMALANRRGWPGWSGSLAMAQAGISRVYVQRGDMDSGMVFLNQVITSTSGLARAGALSQLAVLNRQTGRLDSALVHLRLAVGLYQAAVARGGEAAELFGIGLVFRELGLLDSAMVYYRAALKISEEDGQRPMMWNALAAIGITYSYADVTDSSLVYLRRALALANNMDSPLSRSALYRNVGLTLADIGQLDSAKSYLERSYAIEAQHQRRMGVGMALTLTNLGYFRLKTSADDSTFSLLRRAGDQSLPRLLLARAFATVGQGDSSLSYARRAIELARKMHSQQLEGRALAEVGRALVAQGKVDSARVYFAEAVGVMRAAGFARGVRVALAEMAELFRTTPGAIDLSRATAYYDSAATVVDQARRGAGGEANELMFGETQLDVFGGWARAWVGRSGEVGRARSAAAALAAVERGRAQSLVDMITRLQSTKRSTALAEQRPAAGGDLAVESDSVLSTLRANRVAALTYLLAGDTLFTWLLAPDGALELQDPVALTEGELNRMVRSARRAFDADDARRVQLDPDASNSDVDSLGALGDADEDWKRLAALLLPADLETKVPEGTPIIIVPHGSIGLVPFAALATRRDSSARSRRAADARRTNGADSTATLGRRNPLRFAPSFAALKASEAGTRIAVTPALRTPAARAAWKASRSASGTSTRSASRPRTLATAALVVGNPSMPYVYSGRTATRARLQPLPGAEAESRTIAAQLGTRALTGRAATETSVRARMSGAPLIHFATHGLAYGSSNTARRSFVAFASDSRNDGLLTMGELLDDQSFSLIAELVVLSACQSGLGDMKKAEGSVGLQRALLAKGARSVLVSLWNVDDRATRLLMEKFYAYWLDPTVVRTKATALQMAQNAVRRTPGYANPKYWAAFQLVGAD